MHEHNGQFPTIDFCSVAPAPARLKPVPSAPAQGTQNNQKDNPSPTLG
jgi:hypothetical protein